MTEINHRHIMKVSLRLFAVLAMLGLMASCSNPPTTVTVSPEITALLDRAAIQDHINNYYAQFRKDGVQDFASFFTDDAKLDVNGWVVSGRDGIKGMYSQAGFIGDDEKAPKAEDAVPKGVGETLYTNMDIDLKGDKAVVYMIWLTLGAELLTSPPKVTEYGTEWAELVKQDGRWLFKNRIIRSEGGMPEASLETYLKEGRK
ncbi:MAG: SnoaL-like domain-containing protein [Desulfatiglans sp.]|jgi:ketosteroid isomerase-like protein|nr:SnoaL-like domain-containing protein [Desulfatiglans sp.]